MEFFRFPEVTKSESTLMDQIAHVDSEALEVIRAYEEGTTGDVIEELLDVIHCAETALRMMDLDDRTLWYSIGYVVGKNHARGYYAEEAGTEAVDRN